MLTAKRLTFVVKELLIFSCTFGTSLYGSEAYAPAPGFELSYSATVLSCVEWNGADLFLEKM